MYKIIFYSFNIFIKAFLTLLEILPYLIAGTAIGEALKYIRLHNYIEHFHSKSTVCVTLAASVLGMVSPLCTYGTVPVVMRLAGSGMPAAVLIVFLISSSMMNPQLFILTWGGVSKEIALMRVLTIILFALFMGFILKIIPKEYVLNENFLKECSDKSNGKSCIKEAFTWKRYLISIMKSLEFMWLYLVVGVILASAIEVLIPADIANKLYQQDKMLQIIFMSVLSIPFYTCGGGVIPIVKALMLGGMSKGVVLAFLNVGAATRITVLAALSSIVRPVFLLVYILVLIAFSMITGYLYI
ncbi:MAG TPA: permease [Clostridia bacterium]|nr:permease [Clostridia bacterium]